MFSSQIDSVRYPIVTRWRGIVQGTTLMFAVAAALVSARTAAVTFWVSVAAFLIAAVLRRDIDYRSWRAGPVTLSIVVFLLYALLSSTWAALPLLPLEKACMALLVASGALFMVAMIKRETRPNLVHMGEGLFLGLMFGVVYLFTELLTDQAIKLSVYRMLELRPGELKPPQYFTWNGNDLLQISLEDLTRNMTDAALFLWPTIMAIKGVWQRRWHRAAAASLIVLAVFTVMSSNHASSKMALVAGALAFALSRISLRWAARVMAAGWVIACLAVVPLMLLAFDAGVQRWPGLAESARHRIVIWNFTATRTLKAPLLGIGANMTYVLGPQLEKQAVGQPAAARMTTLSIHSHNIYLQTWFELGLVGAMLLTLVGWSILNAIGGLAPRLRSYGYATFATAATMAASSYGMWQAWFIASFALTAALFTLGAQCMLTEEKSAARRDQSAG